MIFSSLLNMFLDIFDSLSSSFNFPSLPDEVHSHIAEFLEYVQAGASVLAIYTDLGYLLILLGLALQIELSLYAYRLVMWILRKIPGLGIR